MTLIDKSSSQNIAIFGGSFDPIHFGHLAVADFVLENTEIDQILFIPVGTPWQKNQPVASGLARSSMTHLAVAGNPAFSVSDLEINRPEISYTIDTVETLLHEYPKIKLHLILGLDAAKTLPSWNRFEELIKKVSVLVLARESDETAELNYDFKFLNMPLKDISSSQVRERISNNLAVSDLIPAAVNKYINDHNLYK